MLSGSRGDNEPIAGRQFFTDHAELRFTARAGDWTLLQSKSIASRRARRHSPDPIWARTGETLRDGPPLAAGRLTTHTVVEESIPPNLAPPSDSFVPFKRSMRPSWATRPAPRMGLLAARPSYASRHRVGRALSPYVFNLHSTSDYLPEYECATAVNRTGSLDGLRLDRDSAWGSGTSAGDRDSDSHTCPDD